MNVSNFTEFLLENDESNPFKGLNVDDEIYVNRPNLGIEGICKVVKIVFPNAEAVLIVNYEGKTRAISKNWIKKEHILKGKGAIVSKKTGIT
jgi:hypothetical protein